MDPLHVGNLLGFLYVGASDPYRPGVGRKGEVGHPMPFAVGLSMSSYFQCTSWPDTHPQVNAIVCKQLKTPNVINNLH